MIDDLKELHNYLLEQYNECSVKGEEEKANYYFEKAFDCLWLIDLFNEMKLSTNDWHRIKTLVKEYRSIKENETD